MLVTYLTLVEPMPFFRFQDLEMPPPLTFPSSLHPRSHLAFARFFPSPPLPSSRSRRMLINSRFFFCLAFDEWIVSKYAISAPSEVRSMLVLYIPEELLGGGSAAGIGGDDDER